MPIVFVHGVNNRRDDAYRDGVAARNAFLREVVAPSLGSSKGTTIFNPYWGDEAVKFAWNMSVLPAAGAKYEHFGTDDEEIASDIIGGIAAEGPSAGSIVERARKDFAGTVDLLFSAAMVGLADHELDAAAILAASYSDANRYVTKHPRPDWLDEPGLQDANFADFLAANIDEFLEDDGHESFGAQDGLLAQLKEGLDRVAKVLPSVGTDIFARSAREKINATVARFAGDAFVYLSRRGTPDAPGPIPKIVLNDLRQAIAQKAGSDDKLIVVGHSFGGEIVYDLLTNFDTSIKVDCFITVGSQVALFEEMKLYRGSDSSIAAGQATNKVSKPRNVGKWLNVFDTNDVLSFLVEPVFSDTHDYLYATGYGGMQAHSGYFLRPSFYTRLAARLKEL